MTPSSYSIACVQHACGEKKHGSLESLISKIHDAHRQGAQLIVLPELHNSPYFCQSENVSMFELAEPLDGPTLQALAPIAKQLNLIIVASIFEQRAVGLYHNTAIVIDSSRGLVGHYRKMHIPDDPGFYEKFYFTPGDTKDIDTNQGGFAPIDTSLGKIGVLVCWDQWYPEAARLMALSGAELLIYPTAIGWDPADSPAEKSRQLEAWVTIQRSHAIANGIPVACCNRVGHEASPSTDTNGIDFWGQSFIAGPQGEILSHADNQEETILVSSIEKNRSYEVRNIWPFLRDRRIDAYSDLTRRWIDH